VGHQLTRATAATTLIVSLVACGGSGGDGEPTPVLDLAREQVEDAELAAEPDAAELAPASGVSDDGTMDESVVPDELPAPDPSTFEGANRVVNLWVGADGATSPIDVWGRRTFTNGPILLAEGVAFGGASEYFAAPPGYSLAIVGAGAGPDGEERAGLFNAADGEQITTVFTNDDDQGAVSAPNLFELGSDQAPVPPGDGSGLVVLFAPNVRAFSDSLTASIGGDAFYVGDGSPVCRQQRIEATGAAPAVLGGTQRVELELPPGTASLSLHPWFSPNECDQPSALDVDVEVTTGATSLVLVYSPDGTTVDALILPVAP
jgi:hypothetical protein